MAWPGAERPSGIEPRKAATGDLALSGARDIQGVALTGKRVSTDIGIIHDAGHAGPWIIAMPAEPSCLGTLNCSRRWGVEPMFSDFKSRGLGIRDTQIQCPDRLGRLILVISLALYGAVSTGMWDAAENPAPAEKRSERQPGKLARSKLSWFTRGLRKAARLILQTLPPPRLRGAR